jgi:hypothetical protein
LPAPVFVQPVNGSVSTLVDARFHAAGGLASTHSISRGGKRPSVEDLILIGSSFHE